ncbi:isoflavone reductase [Naegleria gruberi]|uniref:Isoflavone reductase n=1 Tax=Naegleria gruberi TaxID=5762 RepID=D2VR24_NAEGR|nr:isoflavone reductase [Naegleria gruberi]EFC40816.1 isoflavone reductase [Naegleria gruberi]|eukprot:XP_002673560.1 isoflavone reductase [Naegleria gruberi strain NEG-M]
MSDSNNYSSVVIVGASGFLGSQITKAFLSQSGVKTHILVRKGSETKVEELVKLGAHLIEGDVVGSTVEELAQSLKGIQVIVSAVSGDHSVFYDGQLKLLNAAKLAGVNKFIPSSFGSNYENFEFGELLLNDPKKKLVVDLKNQTQVDYLLIHTSIFYKFAFYPNFLFEKEGDSYKYYGDLHGKVQLTDTADIAKYVVQAALNPNLKNKSINIAGDELTLKEVADIVVGPQATLVRAGSAQDLLNQIQEKLKNGFAPEEFLSIAFSQLKWGIVSGKSLVEKLDNNLFDVKPTSLIEYAKNQ